MHRSTSNHRHYSRALLILLMIVLGAQAILADTLVVDNTVACSDINGTPYCTIQAAITDAVSGDVISVQDGDYAEALSITKNNLTLLGESRDGVVVRAGNASYTLFVNANNTNITSLTLKEASAFTVHVESSNNVHIEDVRAVGQGRFYNNSNNGVGGIDFINVMDATVKSCISEQHSKNGVSFTGSKDGYVQDCVIQNNGQSEGWAGIALYTFSPFFPNNTTGIRLLGTNVINNTPMGIYMEDIFPYNVEALNLGTVLFSNQTVAPLVNLGFGQTNSDAFATSLGLPARLSNVVPGFLGNGYYETVGDAHAALLLSPSPSTGLIFNLLSSIFHIFPGMNATAALDAADNDQALFFANGNHQLYRLTIDKNISFYGESKQGTVLQSVEDTGAAGDDRAWVLVETGYNFDVMNLTFDGSGNLIYQAIRQKGQGVVDSVGFQNILYQESGPAYAGVGIAAFGTGNVDVLNSMFTNIGRVGVLYFGTGITNSLYQNNMYVGKGDGDFLDYALDISAGANVTILHSDVSNNRGVASIDDSTSACILVTTFFAPGTAATILNNTLHDCSTGIFVGFDSSDTSSVTANFNSITGNGFGVVSTAPLVDATQNWWGSCDGPGGPGGAGSGDNVSTNVTFDPWDGKNGLPQIGACIGNKTNVTCKYVTDNITVSAQINSKLQKDSVNLRYHIGSSMFEKPMSTDDGVTYTATINSTELLPTQTVVWNVVVNDTKNNTFTNGNMTFYVRNRTEISVDPPLPDGLSGWYVTEPVYTLSNDPTAVNTFYQWEAVPPLLYVGPFNLDDIPNAPPKMSAGTLELNAFSNFSSCGFEQDVTKIYFIDLTNPVMKNLMPENDSIVFDNLRPVISAYIDDVFQSNSGINLSTVRIYLDDVLQVGNVSSVSGIDAIVTFVPGFDLTLGKHNVTVMATDIAGRNGNLTWHFFLNETPMFLMTVYEPMDNAVLDSRRAKVNVTVNEKASAIEIINYADRRPRFKRLCRDCFEYGFLRKRTTTLKEGLNNLTIMATDMFGNTAMEAFNVLVDSKKPRISRTLPRQRTVTNGSGFYIRYTEDNLQSITLFYNNNSQNLTCSSGKNQECFVDVDLSPLDGQEIEYFFEVKDMINTVQSRLTRITADTTNPSITLNLPINNTIINKRVQFNVSLNEKVAKLEYLDLSDSNPRFRRLCSNCDEYGESRKRTKTFRVGNHSLIIRATDKAGQTGFAFVNFEAVK